MLGNSGNCCNNPTFEIVWDDESTEITLNVCSCWPNADDYKNLVMWSEVGNGEAVRHAVAWVMKWARDRGVGCWADYSDRYLAEDNAYGQGVLRVRVTSGWQAEVRPHWETSEEMIERLEDSAEIMANIRQDTEETA